MGNPLDDVVVYTLPSYPALDAPIAGEEVAKAVVEVQTGPVIERLIFSAYLRDRRVEGPVLCFIVVCVAIIMARYQRGSDDGSNTSK